MPPTKDQGLDLLDGLSQKCERQERDLRKVACRKAKRFVETRPPDGIPATAMNKPFYVRPKSKKYKGARIDLDIKAGMAFTGPSK